MLTRNHIHKKAFEAHGARIDDERTQWQLSLLPDRNQSLEGKRVLLFPSIKPSKCQINYSERPFFALFSVPNKVKRVLFKVFITPPHSGVCIKAACNRLKLKLQNNQSFDILRLDVISISMMLLSTSRPKGLTGNTADTFSQIMHVQFQNHFVLLFIWMKNTLTVMYTFI